jgi:hypothetical protein
MILVAVQVDVINKKLEQGLHRRDWVLLYSDGRFVRLTGKGHYAPYY